MEKREERKQGRGCGKETPGELIPGAHAWENRGPVVDTAKEKQAHHVV